MRLPGIEPGSAGWQPTIIPLNQRRSTFFNIIIFQQYSFGLIKNKTDFQTETNI